MPHPNSHANSDVWPKLKPAARQMRHEPTPAEARLWQLLRNGKLDGHKFQRQRPVDRFIVDFCCLRAGLIVEVDGEIHAAQIEEDRERDRILTERGFQVLRFANQQVMEQTEQVIEQIRATLKGILE